MSETRYALRGLPLTAAILAISSAVSWSEEAQPGVDSRPPGPVYVLVSPDDESLLTRPKTGDDGKEWRRQLDHRSTALIRVVERSEVDLSNFVDTCGLRLYTDTSETRKRYAELPQQSETDVTLAWLVRELLGRRYAETGIEPERVPIRGAIGEECGNDGMVLIKGGEYERGGRYFTSQNAELEERNGEKYRVKVPAFYIDKYKVTNADYCRFLNAGNPGYWTGASWDSSILRDPEGRFTVAEGRAKRPVVGVNWYQATGYAEWMGRRLPTEAEWEFAAGGAEGRTYPWGNDPPDSTRGHFVGKEYADVDAHPAGRTAEGVFDLAGNAAEWCADFYDDTYYEKAPADGLLKNPAGPPQGLAKWHYRRIFKGFCRVTDSPEFLQCTKRHARPPLLISAIGIRTAKPGCT